MWRSSTRYTAALPFFQCTDTREERTVTTETLVLVLVTGSFVGVAAGYLGSLMIIRRMALVGDALSHVALPGLALGILFGFDPFVGAFLAVFAAMIATWYLERLTKLSVESIVGVLFVLALGVGILMTPQVDLLEALSGNISQVDLSETILTVLVSIGVVLVAKSIYDRLVLSLLSGDLATSMGIKVEQVNFVYLLLVAAVVAIGIKVTGTLLVGALVIVPAAAAKTVSGSLSRYAILSTIFGVIGVLSGILLSVYTGEAPEPMIVVSGAVIFLLGVLFKRGRLR